VRIACGPQQGSNLDDCGHSPRVSVLYSILYNAGLIYRPPNLDRAADPSQPAILLGNPSCFPSPFADIQTDPYLLSQQLRRIVTVSKNRPYLSIQINQDFTGRSRYFLERSSESTLHFPLLGHRVHIGLGRCAVYSARRRELFITRRNLIHTHRG
jgi:hypothetical protein